MKHDLIFRFIDYKLSTRILYANQSLPESQIFWERPLKKNITCLLASPRPVKSYYENTFWVKKTI